MDHGGCFQIFTILNNRILGNIFCKLSCCLLVLLPTKPIYIEFEIPFDMDLLDILVIGKILPGRIPSTISITIYSEASTNTNFLQIYIYQMINFHSKILLEWRLVLRLLLVVSGLLMLIANKVAVFLHILLHKGIIGNEILRLYAILATHKKFLDKLHILLVLLNGPKT